MIIKIKKETYVNKHICYLPIAIYEQFELQPTTMYDIVFGQTIERAYIYPTDADTFIISGSLFPSFQLNDYQLHIWKEKNSICVGPVIGVFLNTAYIADFSTDYVEPFVYNHAIASEQAHCLSYFFSIFDIDWNTNMVHGYVYVNGRFERRWLPFPHVMYDRGASFQTEHKPLVQRVRTNMRNNTNIKFINELDYLGKWEVYERLRDVLTVRHHLPKTIKYKTFNDILTMIDEHNRVFVKSFYGSRAREVMSITKKENVFEVMFIKNDNLMIEQMNVEQLKDHVESFTKHKPFLVQQGISLMTFQQRPFDIRILMLKNKEGRWEVIYDLINLAEERSSITTVRDSRQYDFKAIYSSLCETYRTVPSIAHLHTFAEHVCEAIEKKFGHFAEIGLDVGIDESGHMWLIEANSKPEKYPGPGLPSYVKHPSRSFMATIDYATYITIPHTQQWHVMLKRGNDHHITIPKHMHAQLTNPEHTHVQIGAFSFTGRCETNDFTHMIELPAHVFEQFDGLLDIETNVKIKGNTIHLGPVVAMFISNGQIRKLKRQLPKFRQIEYVHANKKAKTILYFFSIHDVNFIHQKIYGTFFNEQDATWKQRSFPLPDVLYDRGGGVLQKQIVQSDYIRQQLQTINGMKKVNPQHYFDKWDVHKKLQKFVEMQPYLPKAMRYKGIETVQHMFHLSDTLYLKDCHGSNGRGVARVVKQDEQNFIYSYVKDRQLYETNIAGWEELHDAIVAFFQHKRIIVQQGIDVITWNGRNIDLRATVQRTPTGHLDITSYPVRVGGHRSPITSSQTGSEIYRFEYFFKTYLHDTDEQIEMKKRAIEEFLLTCYQSIEKVYGTFGEIGIDFAIDKQGKLWFIECNAKPGFDCMYKSYDRETIERTFFNPLAYAKHLAGF
ncbi:YheC/YheD family protein [Anoxybacillus salavatliensis]|uniref:YheC/YheD family endospore coat-associated protein n=1 Tax=Anoxybacillus TaxID=150247 RepID=UPI0013D06C0E|nr:MULTISPECIES: YheC/YheD family protein [Anoxybacillus]MCQ5365815.1 YheC/YheD family protein [Anoxybacillus gonensis]